MAVIALLRRTTSLWRLSMAVLFASCLLMALALSGERAVPAVQPTPTNSDYYGTPLRFPPPPVDVSGGTVDLEQQQRAPQRSGARSESSLPDGAGTVRKRISGSRAPRESIQTVSPAEVEAEARNAVPEQGGTELLTEPVAPLTAPVTAPAEPDESRSLENPEDAGQEVAPQDEEQVRISPPASREIRPAEEKFAGAAREAADRDPTPAPRAAAPIRLFGTVDFRGILKDLPKWERVLKSERRSPAFTEAGLACNSSDVQARWLKLKNRLDGASLMEKAKGVNRFFNQWPYKTDKMVWGVEDYWATPCEFIRKSGDCEDYAIAKYFALRSMGVPAKTMRIAAVNDTIRGAAHAVLVIFVEKDAYVLDNLTNMVLSHKKLKHYRPVYTVNEEYLWRHVKPVSGPRQ